MKIKAIIRMCVWWFIETAISIRDAKNTIYKFFPVCGGKNYFFSSLSFSKDYYFSKYYMEKNNNPLYISYASFKAEILKGEFVTKGASYKVDIKEPSIIPVSIDERRTLPINPKNGVTISFDKKNLELRNWKDNRFYHLRIENPKTVEITSEKNLIVGAPLALTQKKRMPKKLVMMIFVDSLCWELFRENNLSKELPYLYSFFKKGMVFDECYSWGNWTLTSAANIVTGLTTPNHKLFHPRRNDTLLDDIPIISEYFQRAGYLTFQSCGNWRKTPAYGYVRGYDRTIFKGEMGIEETIYPLLDHLRAFPERDHFMWMSLNDAHHTLRTTQDLSVQSHINLESQDLLDEIDKTFHKTDFIGKKKERYMEELRKIDFHLGMLFQYIESHYKDDEILVSLFSDHGVKYATNDSMLLGRGATHTALMFRGANIPFGRTDELVQTMDILPTMCHFAGIEINGKIDGCLPEVFGGSRARQSVVSEVRYPNDTLKLSVKNHHYDLQLETKEKVNEFGEVDFSKYSSKLFKGSDYSFDVSLQFPEVKKQLESTIDFIKTT